MPESNNAGVQTLRAQIFIGALLYLCCESEEAVQWEDNNLFCEWDTKNSSRPKLIVKSDKKTLLKRVESYLTEEASPLRTYEQVQELNFNDDSLFNGVIPYLIKYSDIYNDGRPKTGRRGKKGAQRVDEFTLWSITDFWKNLEEIEKQLTKNKQGRSSDADIIDNSAVGEANSVTKNADFIFHQPLERITSENATSRIDDTSHISATWFPTGPVPINSPLYIERNSVDLPCKEEIIKPGAFVRIKAPKLMGKTSLLFRLGAYVRKIGYRSAHIDLGGVEKTTLKNLDKFLRWFCTVVGEELEVTNQVNTFWSEELGSNNNCTNYFKKYFLSTTEKPLVLFLDGVDKLFPYIDWSSDFFHLLRTWHDKAKGTNGIILGRLRIVIAYSTDEYIPLNFVQSPLNVGFPISLEKLDQQQISILSNCRGIAWNQEKINNLLAVIGGHPYLIQLAFYYVSIKKKTIEQIVHNASTEAGIYSDHLRSLLYILKQAPGYSRFELIQALNNIAQSTRPIELEDPMIIYQLRSLGLVKKQDGALEMSCQLYRDYFQRVLAQEGE